MVTHGSRHGVDGDNGVDTESSAAQLVPDFIIIRRVVDYKCHRFLVRFMKTSQVTEWWLRGVPTSMQR